MAAKAETDDVTVMIMGDIFVRRDNPAEVFRHITPTLRTADLVIGNLEGAYADGGTPWPKGGINVWKADARQLAAIEAAGFHVMATTNNHIMDFSQDGLLETLGNLDRLGIRHAGAGRNEAEAYAPAIMERKGTRIALLAYTSVYTPGWEAAGDRPGLAVMTARTSYEPPLRFIESPGKPPRVITWVLPDSKERLRADIAAARAEADIVICSFHWGISEGHFQLVDYQLELGHHAVDCGADLIFGHHPHLMQGVEVYKETPIFYSLGNLTFARHNGSRGHELETMILRCRISGGRIAAVDYIPLCSDERLDPHVLAIGDAARVTTLVDKRSERFGTKFHPGADAISLDLSAGKS
ncbi:MAG TPA: CapA family protein [Devosiaceae bacterium]|jgi:poly-gamma-glutamate synthesis protein (capsule biosynthesis protein)